jgi:hypothetical protein
LQDDVGKRTFRTGYSTLQHRRIDRLELLRLTGTVVASNAKQPSAEIDDLPDSAAAAAPWIAASLRSSQ